MITRETSLSGAIHGTFTAGSYDYNYSWVASLGQYEITHNARVIMKTSSIPGARFLLRKAD